jgi:SAM-dependent methyltransferase
VDCRVCGSGRLERFLDLGEQPHCDSLLRPEDLHRKEPYYPLEVCFCHDCTTAQINHTVPKEVMFSEYPYVSGTTQTLRDHFQASADRLVSRLDLRPGDLVVDIGSNDGTWLSSFRRHGVRVLGVESATNLATMARANGVETVNRFFDASVARDIISTAGRPKLMTAAGVFFHLEELHSVTAGIAELCRDGGVFCIQAIYLGAILEYTQFDQVYHEHLTYWTVRSLERLLEQYDLEIVRVDPLNIHGGSLEILVARRGTRRVEPSVDAIREDERRRGYDRIETYHAFTKRVWQIRDELLAILHDYAARGRSVDALGAPAKGGTLLNSFGIATKLVRCATEVNPLKIGKYIPGVRIPIVDERTADRPDAYLILPWNFLRELLGKQKDYIMRGGQFIVPIPKPVVIDRENYRAFPETASVASATVSPHSSRRIR